MEEKKVELTDEETAEEIIKALKNTKKTLEGVAGMSFWDEDNHKVKLVGFVERFIPHNTCVRLFKHTRVKNEQGQTLNQFYLLWRGMDWQITEGYADSDYFKYHPDVEPCPYSEWNVVAITSAGIIGHFTDEASLVVEEK